MGREGQSETSVLEHEDAWRVSSMVPDERMLSQGPDERTEDTVFRGCEA